jgi:hypothetical protein
MVDQRLLPARSQLFPAAKYAPVEKLELDHSTRIEDIADFFSNYMQADLLGVISQQILVASDVEPLSMRHPCVDCYVLGSH